MGWAQYPWSRVDCAHMHKKDGSKKDFKCSAESHGGLQVCSTTTILLTAQQCALSYRKMQTQCRHNADTFTYQMLGIVVGMPVFKLEIAPTAALPYGSAHTYTYSQGSTQRGSYVTAHN